MSARLLAPNKVKILILYFFLVGENLALLIRGHLYVKTSLFGNDSIKPQYFVFLKDILPDCQFF